jgi:hypothetical protein
MTRRDGAFLPLAVAVAAVILPGCGGYTLDSQYRQGIKTVAVDIFGRGKDVYRRELETRSTEAIVKRIEHDTPYKVTVKSRADTRLTGTIDTVEQRILSFNPDTGLPREMELTLTVSFTWTDLRSGKALAEVSDMRVSGAYVREAPLTEDFFQGSEGVLDRLARRVVEKMEAEW